MAHYDAHGQRNRGYDGYGMKEAAYGAAVVGYSATTESYAASTEQVIKMGGYPYSNPGTHGQAWPRSATHIQPKKGDDYDYDYDHNYSYSPKLSHVNASPHDSPRKGTLHRANSPRQGHRYSGMYGNNSPHDSPRKNFRSNFGSSGDDDSSEEEDVECRDGVCYPKPKHSGGRTKKGNGYGAAGTNYPLTHSADRDHDSDRDHLHHQKSDPRKHYNSTEKQPEANHIYGNSHAKPVTDAYFDRFSYPANNYTVPAPIKTRPDHHRDAKNSPKGAAAHWTPFGGPPRNEHQEMTTEAHNRRHGTTPPPQSDHKYKKTIDSETLAKMYGGVFVK